MISKVARPKLINHVDPLRSFTSKIETGAQLFGAAKGIYDGGKTVLAVGRAVAPYVATAARTLL